MLQPSWHHEEKIALVDSFVLVRQQIPVSKFTWAYLGRYLQTVPTVEGSRLFKLPWIASPSISSYMMALHCNICLTLFLVILTRCLSILFILSNSFYCFDVLHWFLTITLISNFYYLILLTFSLISSFCFIIGWLH